MDYPTLLLQLENQLQSLHKKGIDYLNIEAMPKVELKRLLDGLGELVVSQTEVSDEQQSDLFSLSARTEPEANIQYENTDHTVFSPSTSFENFQNQLMTKLPKRCDEIDWTLFGWSMTIYNMLLSMTLGVLCFSGGLFYKMFQQNLKQEN